MSTIRESDLPGIGRKFQIEAQSGDRLIVVVHDDGRRELYHFDPNDPDELLSMVTLNDTEARQVAGIIGGLNYTPKALESMSITFEGLLIEWYKIESGLRCDWANDWPTPGAPDHRCHHYGHYRKGWPQAHQPWPRSDHSLMM